MTRPTIALLALCASLSACVHEARIRMPAGMDATTDRVELTGMGGWQSGSFRLGDLSGQFERRSSSLALFDRLFVRRYGGASFTVSGPQLPSPLVGQCGFAQSSVNLGPLSGRSQPLVYRCEFESGRQRRGFLEVRDRDGFLGSPDGRDARVGFGEFDGVRFSVRSLHHAAGSPIPLPTPLGYAIEHNGGEVGAVDLNGPNKTLYVSRDPRLRYATLSASLALSVFWDPAEVGDD